MLENASQHIACDFDVSQELWNVPSRVYRIAACGWALRHINLEYYCVLVLSCLKRSLLVARWEVVKVIPTLKSKSNSATLCHNIILYLDHNALASIVSFNLPFFPTTRTLYQTFPLLMRINNIQTSCFISYGGRRTRHSKFTSIRVWSLMTGWGSSVDLLS